MKRKTEINEPDTVKWSEPEYYPGDPAIALVLSVYSIAPCFNKVFCPADICCCFELNPKFLVRL